MKRIPRMLRKECPYKVLVKMKLIVIILVVAAGLQVNANCYAQNTVTLSERNSSLIKVFKQIKKQTGYSYILTSELLGQAGKVNIEVTNVTLKEALDIIFREQPLAYAIIGKTIVVKEKEEEKEKSKTSGILSENPIKGRVTDEDGQPIAGANVSVRGTNKVVTTNSNGEFMINDVADGAELEVSYVGYEKKTIVAKYGSVINTSLAILSKELDVAVVQAYGTTTRRLNTGNISKVSSEEINRQPVSNPLAALSGRVPGLVISQKSGLPGSSFKVQIRGQSALGVGATIYDVNSDPLFIIDGVPYAPNNTNINRISSSLGPYGLSPFSNINPNDIESIEILKDADATAIYGSQGANGVIVITTKKAKPGKTTVNASTYTGISRVSRSMDFLSTPQYLQMRREAFRNDGVTPTTINAPDLLLWDTTSYTDFKKLLIGNNAYVSNTQVSINGGTANTQFLLGIGYNNQTNVFSRELNDKRTSLHFNANHSTVDRKFGIALNGSYSVDKNTLNSTDLTAYINLPPNYPKLIDSAGNLAWQVQGSYFGVNPLSYLLSRYYANTNSLLSNLLLKVQLSPRLVLRVNAGYNTVNVDEISANPKTAISPQSANRTGYSSFGNNKFTTWNIEPQGEYTYTSNRSKLNVLIGSTIQKTENSGSLISATGYINDALLRSLAGAAAYTANNSFSEYKYAAIFGRVNFNYQLKYIINLTARRDASSRFGPGRQFGNFGASGLAWIFSNENFFKERLRAISYGKLRISYGVTGGNASTDYQYLSTWSSTTAYQGIPGLSPSRLANPDYQWETTQKLEAALELGLFKDRVLLSGAYYRNRSGNKLINYQLPSQTGFAAVYQNFQAVIHNSGVEIGVVSKNIVTEDFSWTVSGNLTVPKNKLVSFPDLESSSYSVYRIGQPLSLLYGYQFIGVNPSTGVYAFKDLNSDSLINSKDFNVFGNLEPKFYGAFSNNVRFKNWELELFFEFRKQYGASYLASSITNNPPGTMFNQPVLVINRWQKVGDQTDIQKYTATLGSAAYNAAQTFALTRNSGWYDDASYIRLKNVAVSYTVQNWLSKKIKIETIKVFLQAQNIATITKYKGADPETQSFLVLPPLKTITAGIQIIF